MGKPFQLSISDFSGGLNTADSPTLVADNEFVIGQNVVIVGKGKLQKRFGNDLVSSGGSGGINGILNFPIVGTNAAKYLLIFNNGNVYTITPSSSTWVLRGTFGSGTDRVNGAVFNNIAVFGDGTATPGKFSAQDVQVTGDGATGNTSAIATSIAEGATDKQTLSGITAGLEVSSIEVNIDTVGTGDWTVTVHDSGNNVLASKTIANASLSTGVTKFSFDTTFTSGDEDHFHITSTVADGVVVSGSNNDLETAQFDIYLIKTQNLGGSPPQAKLFAVDNHFLLASGVTSAPSVVYWPDTDNPDAWASGVAGNVVVSKDDGQKVTGLISHNDQFLAFKDYAKHALDRVFNASEVTTGYAQKETVDRSDGTRSGNSLAAVRKQGVMFLGEESFQSYGFVENYGSSRLPENLSEKIAPTVEAFNQNAISKATAVFDRFRNKYRCSVPTGTSETNDCELIYDLRFAAWTVNKGLSISDYDIFEDADGKREIYFGSETEGKIYKFNSRFSDAYDDDLGTGSGIDSVWRSKTYNAFNSDLAFNNRFDRLFIRGALTNPFNGKFSITVFNGNKRVTEYFDITEDDIDGSGAVGGYVGDTYIGLGYIGSGGTSTGEQQLFPFFKEIHFPSTINEGREIYVGMRSSNDLEGFRIDDIIITGEKQPDSVIT